MKFGFVFPGGDARTAAEFAHEAEIAGWDGFFVWDPVWGVDPWVSLAGAAMLTSRIRLGTMLTPISRRRPWKLAGETASLDRLSNGRVILAAGLGAVDTGFEQFGEETDRKTRAELLDEGLEIITGLWQGQPFNFNGKHYHIRETKFGVPPPPIQTPRIPIWIVGAWPRPKSMQRVLRWDGLLPTVKDAQGNYGRATPEEIQQMKVYIAENRQTQTTFDIVVEGQTSGEDLQQATSIIRPYAEAGATWWLEAMWDPPSLDPVLARIRQGPSRFA